MTMTLWYLGRGFGVSALVLLSMVVALGMAVRAGRPLPGLSRSAQQTLHRVLSLTAVQVVLLHVLTLWADPYAQLRVVDAVVPFAGRLHPIGLGLGTVALELVVALVVSSLLRRRIGLRLWRAIHWLAYLFWPLSALHALGTGTDRGAPWFQWTVAACGALVGAALTWRIAHRQDGTTPPRPAPPRELAGLR